MTNATVLQSADLAQAASTVALKAPLYMLLLIPLGLFLFFYLSRGGLTRKKAAFLGVRLLILLLTVLALSQPVLTRFEEEVGTTPPITVLVDSSPSMGMYRDVPATGYVIYERLKAMFQNLTGDSSRVNIEFFSNTNSTAVGDALYSTLTRYPEESTYSVLLSDGQTNSGRNPVDMAKIMAKTNSTVYTVSMEKGADDVYIVDVLGDKKVPSNIKYDLVVRVGYTGFSQADYELKLYLDGVEKYSKKYSQTGEVSDIPLELTLKDVGLHEIVASIQRSNDPFSENNRFYKPVEVVAKPKILVVSANRTSPMLEILNKLYNVELTSRVDNDYSKYACVVFDNINAAEFPRDRVNKIKKYVLDGNGAVFVGGRNSFEYGGYNNSFIENILPVKSTEKPVERRRSYSIVFMIDVSESTEYGVGQDSKIDVEKAVALRMLRALDGKDSVAVIAFNTMPYVVSPLSPLGEKFQDVENSILRLRFGGGTDLLYPFESADNILSGGQNQKYIILLSDGVIRGSRMQMTLNKVAELKNKGVKTYSVGVGFDTAENFMQQIALDGGGQYFSLKSDPDRRLKLVFGEQEDDKTKDTTPVILTTNTTT